MTRKCCVVGCKSNYDSTNEKFPTFAFPKNIDLCNLWLKAIGRENFNPTKYSVVCSKHFIPELITTKGSKLKAKSVLKENSVPTIFIDTPIYYESTKVSEMEINDNKCRACESQVNLCSLFETDNLSIKFTECTSLTV